MPLLLVYEYVYMAGEGLGCVAHAQKLHRILLLRSPTQMGSVKHHVQTFWCPEEIPWTNQSSLASPATPSLNKDETRENCVQGLCPESAQ